MTTLAQKIAREHRLSVLGGCVDCDAVPDARIVGGEWFAEHIATVTEAAVREAVADEISEDARVVEHWVAESPQQGDLYAGVREGLHRAIGIALGDAS